MLGWALVERTARLTAGFPLAQGELPCVGMAAQSGLWSRTRAVAATAESQL